MLHDLYRIAQEFTVWKRWAATGNLEHPFFFRAVHTGCVGFNQTGGWGTVFMIPARQEWCHWNLDRDPARTS